jgi:hypothetical protein
MHNFKKNIKKNSATTIEDRTYGILSNWFCAL